MPATAADAAFSTALLAAIPELRQLARARCRQRADADDLVQAVLLKAWSRRGQYQSGNLGGWLAVMLLNQARDDGRKQSVRMAVMRALERADGSVRDAPVPGAQEDHCVLREAARVLREMPRHWQQALADAVNGLTYQQAAQLRGVELGTIRSRLFRARDHVRRMVAG